MSSLNLYLYLTFNNDEDTIFEIKDLVEHIKVNNNRKKILVIIGDNNSGKTTLINKIKTEFEEKNYSILPCVNTHLDKLKCYYELCNSDKKFFIIEDCKKYGINNRTDLSEFNTNLIVKSNYEVVITSENHDVLTIHMNRAFTLQEQNMFRKLKL